MKSSFSTYHAVSSLLALPRSSLLQSLLPFLASFFVSIRFGCWCICVSLQVQMQRLQQLLPSNTQAWLIDGFSYRPELSSPTIYFLFSSPETSDVYESITFTWRCDALRDVKSSLTVTTEGIVHPASLLASP